MPELPTTFGKYYLTEKLATGGMAEIYLAKLIGPGGFERFVVIKQILPKLSGQRHFVDLFVAEAKTLVTLAHGNIVPVYELGVVDDTYFIAMDYIDGPTLYRLTEIMARREAQMEPAAAAWITARILDGLDYAHRKGEGVIHRDLSPRNVMLSRDGDVKIVDFGIAVTLGDGSADESHQSAPTGSFPYMSPEQVRREALTPQTDLFTVGVLFWEMLTGTRLFARSDADATLQAVLESEIPVPSSVRADVPVKLDELAMRALERDQSARWANAGEMLAALNKYLYSLDETPGPREVAALVAKYCPPETRRLPTNMEADGSGPVAAPGPSTAVIPRDAVAQGKRNIRHQTFATHVELRDMLGETDEPPTTKVTARPTIVEDEPPLPPPTTKRPVRATTERPEAIDDDRPIPRPAPTARNLAEPPKRSTLIVIGLGGIALAAAVVYMVRDGGDHVRLMGVEDASVFRDAPALILVEPDAALIDAGEPDAALPIDAGVRVARDAAVVTTRDAAIVIKPDAVATGTATLTLGANPWAKVFIDGKEQKKHAPNTFDVSAGHHEIRLVFDGESPAVEKTYSVDVKAGEMPSFQADFSH